MQAIERRTLGETDAVVTKLGFGSAGIGDLNEALKEDQVQQILQAAWDGGIRYFDTSPFYGHGKSEHRMGHFLRQQPRSEFVISTKVGRVFRTQDKTLPPHRKPSSFVGALPFEFAYDYSYDGIMRSYEDSLQRLSLPSIDLLLIHDLDFRFHKTEALVTAYLAQLATSGWRALEELRSSGAIKGVGAGINEVGMIPRFLDLVDLDFFLVALYYNLLDQDMLKEDLPRCAEAGVGIVGGAIFASGILASGPVAGAYYDYAPATPEILEKTRRIEAVCRRHDTPLAAAAMQFPLAHPLVAAIIPGAIRPEQVGKNLQLLRHPIPAQLWTDLKDEGLLAANAPTPA
ncbi:MAG: aldo/keto reductase [Caldilineaceae bacterium]|nr:aldo/keto reductase [Caldilineaceae bacterium]